MKCVIYDPDDPEMPYGGMQPGRHPRETEWYRHPLPEFGTPCEALAAIVAHVTNLDADDVCNWTVGPYEEYELHYITEKIR